MIFMCSLIKAVFFACRLFQWKKLWVTSAVRYHINISKLFHDTLNPSCLTHQLAGAIAFPSSFKKMDSNDVLAVHFVSFGEHQV